MSIAYWQDDTRDQEHVEVDVLIIGGGITGWSTAYWLSGNDMKLAVVDQGDICAGASGRNAGFITCGSVEHYARQVSKHGAQDAAELFQYARDNMDLIKSELIAKGVECEFRQVGTYSLAGTEHELAEIGKSTALMQANGIPVSMVDAEHCRKELGASHFAGGALYHEDGECHPVKLVRGIAEHSEATFYPHHEVFDLSFADDGTVTARTQRHTFTAGAVVIATNGYSHLLHPWFQDKIYPTRGQIIVTEPVAPFMEAPCYANFVLDYFRQLQDGRVLIGGFRQLARESEVGVADVPNPEIHEALTEFLNHHFESLRGVRIDYKWAGIMGFSADGVPMIGALPGRPTGFFVGGFTAHGIGMAFRCGQLLARMMLHGEQPKHLSSRRF